MKHSIFNALLSVKDRLTKSIGSQLNLASVLSDAYEPSIADGYASFNDASLLEDDNAITMDSDCVVKVGTQTDSSILTYSVASDSLTDGHYSGQVDTSSEDFSIDSNLIPDSALIDDSQLFVSVRTLLTNLMEGESVNEALEKVNELFLNSTNVSTADAINMINTVAGLRSSDLNQLKNYLTSLSDEGKISNYSWVSFMATLMEGGKKQCDSGSLKVQSEDFFRLQSFMNTVMQVVSISFQIIIGVLGAIFSGLYYVLSSILNVFTNLFDATFNTQYEYNSKASYPGVKGTLFAGSPSFISDLSPVGTNELMRIQLGSEDVFLYKVINPEDPTKYSIYMQDQLVVSFEPLRYINYLKNIMHLTSTYYDDYYGISRYNWGWSERYHPWDYSQSSMTDDNDPYLSASEYINMGIDSTFLVRTVKINVLAAYMSRTLLTSVNQITYGAIVSDSVSYANNGAGERVALAYIDRMLRAATDSDILNVIDSIPDAAIRYIIEQLIRDNSIATDCSQYNYTDVGCNIISYRFAVHPSYTYVSVSGSAESGQVIGFHANANLEGAFPDVIPTEDIVAVPSTDTSTVVAALAVVSGILIGSIILGKKIHSALRAKKQTRQAKRVQKLNAAREAWLADPNDATLRKQYTTQLRKYNFKASLFGWGSYDSANGWINAADSDSTSSILNQVTNTTIEETDSKIIKLITNV